MGLLATIREWFIPSPEELERLQEEKKRRILRAMVRLEDEGIETPCPRQIQQRAGMPMSVVLEILPKLVEAGFVQRIDGGKKELATKDCNYAISDNGLGELHPHFV